MDKETYYNVSIAITLRVKADSADKAIEYVENIELPSGYVEDSFEMYGAEIANA